VTLDRPASDQRCFQLAEQALEHASVFFLGNVGGQRDI